VDIPHIFDLYNEAMIYNSPEKPRKYYSDKREIKENNVLICALSANYVWKSVLRKYPYRNCWRKHMLS